MSFLTFSKILHSYVEEYGSALVQAAKEDLDKAYPPSGNDDREHRITCLFDQDNLSVILKCNFLGGGLIVHEMPSCCGLLHVHSQYNSFGAEPLLKLVAAAGWTSRYTMMQCELVKISQPNPYRVWKEMLEAQEISFRSIRTGSEIQILTAFTRDFRFAPRKDA